MKHTQEKDRNTNHVSDLWDFKEPSAQVTRVLEGRGKVEKSVKK